MDYVTHLETLGLEPGASPEEIRLAFRNQVRAWDPDRMPDSPSYQKEAARKRTQLEGSYRFLMDRYGLEPVDLETVPLPPRPEPNGASRAERVPGAKARPEPPRPRRKIPIARMILATGALFVAAGFLLPAIRSGTLVPLVSETADRALEFSLAKLAPLLPMARRSGSEAPARTSSRFVESLPRLTPAQVLSRYGTPRRREAGKWIYAGFTVLFQDDSVASLLVRDSTAKN